jgi:hypothetical protein
VDIECCVKESPDSAFRRVYLSCREGNSLLSGIMGPSLSNDIIIECLYPIDRLPPTILVLELASRRCP